jgi:hypothetical protein
MFAVQNGVREALHVLEEARQDQVGPEPSGSLSRRFLREQIWLACKEVFAQLLQMCPGPHGLEQYKAPGSTGVFAKDTLADLFHPDVIQDAHTSLIEVQFVCYTLHVPHVIFKASKRLHGSPLEHLAWIPKLSVRWPHNLLAISDSSGLVVKPLVEVSTKRVGSSTQ